MSSTRRKPTASSEKLKYQ
ncbi:unnamed protein product, partial [Rotaria sordida]